MANVRRAVSEAVGKLSWSKYVTALAFSLLATRLPPVRDWSSFSQLLAAIVLFVLLAIGVESFDRRFLEPSRDEVSE